MSDPRLLQFSRELRMLFDRQPLADSKRILVDPAFVGKLFEDCEELGFVTGAMSVMQKLTPYLISNPAAYEVLLKITGDLDSRLAEAAALTKERLRVAEEAFGSKK